MSITCFRFYKIFKQHLDISPRPSGTDGATLNHFGHPGHTCAEPSRHCGTMSRTKTQRHREIFFCLYHLWINSDILDTGQPHSGHPSGDIRESLNITFCVFNFQFSIFNFQFSIFNFQLSIPILDNLDTPVQNHPVIAVPCLARRRKNTKKYIFYHEKHESTRKKLESADYCGVPRCNSLTIFSLCVFCAFALNCSSCIRLFSLV